MSQLPVICLVSGLTIGLLFGNPFSRLTNRAGKWLLQFSVVALGSAVDLATLWRAGFTGMGLSLLTLLFTLGLGHYLGSKLGLSSNLSLLIGIGTGICGGSAIAAAAPVLKASNDEIAASLATVFLLNAVGLILFPEIGRLLGLTPEAFAHWAALSIHDTSSVVGAALSFSPESLPTATTVKLSRALWIAPCCVVLALYERRRSQQDGSTTSFKLASIPWFIPGFIITALLRALFPHATLYDSLNFAAKIGLSLSLLCIGAGVTRATLQSSGKKAFSLGLVLWIATGFASLFWIQKMLAISN